MKNRGEKMKVYSQGDQAIVVSLQGDVTPVATE